MKYPEPKKVVISLIALGCIFLGTSWYVQQQQFQYVSALELLAAKQEKNLVSLAQLIDRDGADAVVYKLIPDCQVENRARFDELLSRLESLPPAEIQEVDSLFDACGDYYAQRRAVMVARLTREYEVYRDYVSLLMITDKRTETLTYPVEKWTQLVEFEQQRSDLSEQTVRIQDEIISKLLEGVRPSAPEIQASVLKASELRDTLSYVSIQIDLIREDILDI